MMRLGTLAAPAGPQRPAHHNHSGPHAEPHVRAFACVVCWSQPSFCLATRTHLLDHEQVAGKTLEMPSPPWQHAGSAAARSRFPAEPAAHPGAAGVVRRCWRAAPASPRAAALAHFGAQRVLVVTAEAGHQLLQMHRQIECRLVDREMLVTGAMAKIRNRALVRPNLKRQTPITQRTPVITQGAKGFKEPKPQRPPPTNQRQSTQRGQRQQQRLSLRHLGGKHIAGAYKLSRRAGRPW